MSRSRDGSTKGALEHPLFEIVTTTAGAVSIRNKAVNEIMHNPVGPWVEANALYIDQSNLRERLLTDVQKELVIFDVGLGAAANAVAALSCIDSLGVSSRPVRLVSFERDLDLLRFALDHADHFAHFAPYTTAMEELLRLGTWSSGQSCRQNPTGKIRWELRTGNFLDLIETEILQPHLIFFDPYSPKVNQEMWTSSCFRKLRRICRSPEEGGTDLYTYSQATRIRVALLQAGFCVGYGVSTGLKEETTQASTDYRSLKSPLGKAWFERWRRSHIRYPFDCEVEAQAEVDQCVEDYMSHYCGELGS